MDKLFDLISNENYLLEETETNLPLFYFDNKSLIISKFKLEINFSNENINKILISINVNKNIKEFLNKCSNKLNLELLDNNIRNLENSSININMKPKDFMVDKFKTELMNLNDIQDFYNIRDYSNGFLNFDNYDIEDLQIIQEN